MKALSIRQPFAWFITHRYKDIENRSWKPHNQNMKFRGRFLIHAGKEWYPGVKSFQDAEDLFTKITHEVVRIPRDIGFGGIVGEAEIIDVVNEHDSPWFVGPVGLVIRNAAPRIFFPYNGQLGFFDVSMP